MSLWEEDRRAQKNMQTSRVMGFERYPAARDAFTFKEIITSFKQ